MDAYRLVLLRDLSLQGCSIELVDRVTIREILWVRFPGIEARQGVVSWEKDFSCGIEFDTPFHPAVMDMLVTRLTG